MKIGIDIGGSHIACGIVLDDGTLSAKESRDLEGIFSQDKNNKRIDNKQPELDEEKQYEGKKEEQKEQVNERQNEIQYEKQKIAQNTIVKIIDEEIQTLLEKNKLNQKKIEIIGIAAPGNPTDTSIRNVVNLHIKEFDIVSALKEKYNCQIKIKNDGKCAGLAEKRHGALKEYDDCVFLCIGTGVGSAVFLDGKLLEPKKATGFEFGHMIISKNGKMCNCGSKGCFETYASMKRFKEHIISTLGLDRNMESSDVQDYIRKAIKENEINSNIKTTNIDDKNNANNKIVKLVDEYIEDIAIGVSNIINIFEPEAICFGGSFAYYGDIFLPILNKKIKRYLFNKDLECKFITAKLGNDAGIIGAVELT